MNPPREVNPRFLIISLLGALLLSCAPETAANTSAQIGDPNMCQRELRFADPFSVMSAQEASAETSYRVLIGDAPLRALIKEVREQLERRGWQFEAARTERARPDYKASYRCGERGLSLSVAPVGKSLIYLVRLKES